MATPTYGKKMPMHDNGNEMGEKEGGNGQQINTDMRSNFGRRHIGTMMNGNLPMPPHDPFTGEPTGMPPMPMRHIEVTIIKKKG